MFRFPACRTAKSSSVSVSARGSCGQCGRKTRRTGQALLRLVAWGSRAIPHRFLLVAMAGPHEDNPGGTCLGHRQRHAPGRIPAIDQAIGPLAAGLQRLDRIAARIVVGAEQQIINAAPFVRPHHPPGAVAAAPAGSLLPGATAFAAAGSVATPPATSPAGPVGDRKAASAPGCSPGCAPPRNSPAAPPGRASGRRDGCERPAPCPSRRSSAARHNPHDNGSRCPPHGTRLRRAPSARSTGPGSARRATASGGGAIRRT